MSHQNNTFVHENKKRVKTAYQQLSGILNSVKSNEISLSEALSKIQLKEGNNKKNVERPYCKVVNGVLELNGITEKPISMNFEQWKSLLNLIKSNYVDNYIKYNEGRITGSGVVNETPSKVNSTKPVFVKKDKKVKTNFKPKLKNNNNTNLNVADEKVTSSISEDFEEIRADE